MAMHYANMMVGAISSNYTVSLWKRYTHQAKHRNGASVFTTFFDSFLALGTRLRVSHG